MAVGLSLWVIGSAGCGKTSLIHRFICNTSFHSSREARRAANSPYRSFLSVGANLLAHMEIRSPHVRFTLHTFPEDACREAQTLPTPRRRVDAVILCCDITKMGAIAELWESIAGIRLRYPEAGICLCGTKLDDSCHGEQQHSESLRELRTLAARVNAHCFLTSARTGANVHCMFTSVALPRVRARANKFQTRKHRDREESSDSGRQKLQLLSWRRSLSRNMSQIARGFKVKKY